MSVSTLEPFVLSAPEPLGVGVHADIPFSRYLSDPCAEPSLSSSTIRDLLRSPAHAHRGHPRLGGGWGDDSGRANLGTAVHALVLGGEERLAWIDAADWRTAAAKSQRDAAYNARQVPLLARERPAIEAAANAARAALAEMGFAGEPERTLVWREGPTWCRARPDLLTPGTIIDLKTAENADPSDWIRRSMIAGGYHVQAAWYLRGAAALLPEPDRDFVCLVVELEPPHACSFVGVGPELLAIGQAVVESGLKRWRECMESGVWPGYASAIHWAEAPAWLQYDLAGRGIGLSDAGKAGAER